MKITDIDGWNAYVYSKESYLTFNFSFSVNSMNPSIFAGLSIFPSLNTNTSNIDYGYYISDDWSVYIYENDNLLKICMGEFTTITLFGIQYDGKCMSYFID